MKRSLLLIITGLLILTWVLGGCASKTDSESSSQPAEPVNVNTEEEKVEKSDIITLKVGATPVPHSEILNFVKPQLEKEGIILEIIEFTDYVTPNLALNDGDLDANFFQHEPYMETFARERGIELYNAGNVHVEPLGLYSNKIVSIEELKDGATIAIPNDPTNGGRALILLDSKGIIKLKDDAGLEATERDIAENPKNLKFRPIDAAQLPRTLDDVDAAIINTNYALEAGLNPSRDALIIEGDDSPYANIITVRPEDKDNEAIKKLVKALQTEEVKKFIEEQYGGSIVPAF